MLHLQDGHLQGLAGRRAAAEWRQWFDYGIILLPLGTFQVYFTNVREPMTHQTGRCWFWKRERKSLLWSQQWLCTKVSSVSAVVLRCWQESPRLAFSGLGGVVRPPGWKVEPQFPSDIEATALAFCPAALVVREVRRCPGCLVTPANTPCRGAAESEA